MYIAANSGSRNLTPDEENKCGNCFFFQRFFLLYTLHYSPIYFHFLNMHNNDQHTAKRIADEVIWI